MKFRCRATLFIESGHAYESPSNLEIIAIGRTNASKARPQAACLINAKILPTFPLDKPIQTQFHLDFRTGRPTTISGPVVTHSERAAWSALNARRARGILQVSQLSPSRESHPPDVWAALFIRKTREWDVPLISLSKLGLLRDQDGFLESQTPDIFHPLKSGAEACPYVDLTGGVVYKLFFLLRNGALGKN